MTRRLLPVLVVLSLVAAACGADKKVATSSSTTASTTEASASPTSAPSTDAGPGAVGPFSTEDVATEDFPYGGPSGGTALLVAVRAAAQQGFDRVVFEFERGEVPGYRVRYVQPPITEDASGETVKMKGKAFIEIHMTGASGVDQRSGGEHYKESYTGPTRFSPTTGVIAEVVRTGDFEANLTWVVGVNQPEPGFAVEALEGPPRLVIDIRA